MAQIRNHPPIEIDTFNVLDYQFLGKMLVGQVKVSPETVYSLTNDFEFQAHVKRTLATQLAKKMVEDKLIEFTTVKNPYDFTHQICVRCFLMPDADVKVVRTRVDL